MSNQRTFFGPLKDARHERFCQEIVRGTPVASAMVAAGYSGASAESNGKKILKRDYVQQRIAEIQVEGVSVAADAPPPRVENPTGRPPDPVVTPETIDLGHIDQEWILRRAIVAYTAAEAQRNVPHMVKLLELIGRLKGIDKRPVGRPPHAKDPNKGDVSNDKAKPQNPSGLAEILAGLSGGGERAGSEFEEEETSSESDDDGSAEEV